MATRERQGRRQKITAILRNIRVVAVVAMLCALIAGLLGYDDTARLIGAALGAVAGTGLKIAHILPA